MFVESRRPVDTVRWGAFRWTQRPSILAPVKNELEEPLINTPLATVQRTAPGWVEVRFKLGAVLNVAGIAAILNERDQLAREGPDKVLIVFPPEELDFEMSMITTDHYHGRSVEQYTAAAAWAARNEHNERFARLYFAYFPSPMPSAIFKEESEARAWLCAQGGSTF